MRNLAASHTWKQKLGIFGLLFAILLATSPTLPVSAGHTAQFVSVCRVNVDIIDVMQNSLNEVKIEYEWETTGVSDVEAHIEIFPGPPKMSEPVWDATYSTEPPDGSQTVIADLTGLVKDTTYWATVTITNGCKSVKGKESFYYHECPPPLCRSNPGSRLSIK